MMAIAFRAQLIALLLILICSTIEVRASRHRRQTIGAPNANVGVPQARSEGSMAINKIPYNSPNNPNPLIPNEQINQRQVNSNNQFMVPSQPQAQPQPVRGQGFYNSPAFQSSPFTGNKPAGWFGTNHVNWVSNQNSELDKNKLAAEKNVVPNKPQVNQAQIRQDGGPFFLAKVAKQYASKGAKAFNFGPNESREGRGSTCYNHDNFDGYVFGRFQCPLPASTGMNQLDQFCCGLANYQYCCNAQEFSQYQRGVPGDHGYIGGQRMPRRSAYPSSTKRILAVILPLAGLITITGIVALVVLYYKKFRKEQRRTRKPSGAIRLEDNYSIVPQDPPVDKLGFTSDE